MPPKTASSAFMSNPNNTWISPIYHHIGQSLGPSNIITTAGQVGIRPDNTTVSEPVEQIHQAFANLSRCLEAAGASSRDVIKLTFYCVDYDKPLHREPLNKFLGDHRPPITLVPVPKLALPGLIFEVEATAAIPLHPLERVDCVIVGAGLSGLQAAVNLHKAGLSVKVLEARDRVGGKTWSKAAQGSICDVGAAWINDTNQSKVFALAKRFGFDLVTQNTDGKIVVDDGIGRFKTHPYGQLIPDAEDKADVDEVVRIRDIFEETCQRIDIRNPVRSGKTVREDLDNITFEQWARSLNLRSEHAFNALKVGTRAMLGVEPNEISALYFLDYCKSGGGYMQMRSDQKGGGQYLRIAQGTQSLSKSLAEELPPNSLVLHSPVRRIEQQDGYVRVVSARGIFEATRVIVSVPTPLYKEIMFEPPLPADKVQLADTAKAGDTCKVILMYKQPWWRNAGLCGLAQSPYGPISVTRDTSVDQDGQFSLTCFVTGQPARDWMKLSSVDRNSAVLGQIRKLFSPSAEVEEPIEIMEQIWRNEQWTQGCPCPVLGPGGLTRFEDTLRAPYGPMHFVGTETAFEWKGYMDGALSSGERGAKEVLSAISKSRT